MDEKLLEIKKCIDKYVKEGNDLYIPAKSLPFYEKMNSYRRWIFRSTGERITLQEIFFKCGIVYDKEYDKFLNLRNKINLITDLNDIDAIKKDRKGSKSIMGDLKTISTRYNCNYADYLYVMMNLKLKKLTAKTNYLEQLKNELEIAYPDHNLNGIKRDNPNLYNKICHIKKYSKEFSTTNEVINYLGFYIDKSKSYNDSTINKFSILKELAVLYPDKIVANLSKNYNNLYCKISKLSAKEGKNIGEFLKENGFTYTTFCMSSRLSNSYIDAEMYYNNLQRQIDPYYKKIDLKNLNDYEKFKLNLKVFTTICANQNKEKESQI